jgi:hypothetical protein
LLSVDLILRMFPRVVKEDRSHVRQAPWVSTADLYFLEPAQNLVLSIESRLPPHRSLKHSI